MLTGIATKDFYIGSLGITSRPVNFTNFTDPFPSMLGTLWNNKQIPSLSFGYTAGAIYQPKPEFGSLTFGGYDSTRFQPENLTIAITPDTTRDLLVGIIAIESGQHSLLPTQIVSYIDSTVAQIWLPVAACQRFESVFGLIWNETLNLYLVNDTLHTQLISLNPSITFTLSSSTSDEKSDKTLNITLPYSSFDLTASFPLVGNTTSRYFPLRRAQNASQYTLGRTFLQESYLIVDYSRSTFVLSQALFPDPGVSANLVPIYAPTNSSDTSSTTSSSPPLSKKLSQGDIAGIVVSIIVFLIGFCAGIYYYFHQRNRDSPSQEDAELTSSSSSADQSKQPTSEGELDAQETQFVGHEVSGQGLMLEMDGSGGGLRRVELGGVDFVSELYSREEVWELEGE